MIVNGANLRELGVSFKASFQGGLDMAEPLAQRVSTTVPSNTGTEEYGWLGRIAAVREWLGDRQVNNITSSGYTIKNKDYENTISVPRNDIEDDNLGLYGPMFTEFGRTAAAHKEQMVWPLLQGGFNSLCFDGQPYFSTAHPLILPNGQMGSYANTDANPGNGPTWFLIDDTRALKPILFQDRKPFQFVAKDRVDDENVFSRKEFLYGIDARRNVGFGFPQFAWGSMLALNAANYSAARANMRGLVGDFGIKLGIRPKLLAVPPELEGAGLQLLNADRNADGSTNVWKGTAELLVVEWLN